MNTSRSGGRSPARGQGNQKTDRMAIPVSAEHIFTVAGLPVTNSLMTGSVVAALFLITGLVLRRKRAAVPRGAQNAAEALIEFMLGFCDQVTHDRARSRRFFPIVGSLFLFILISNWFGLLPGVGTIGIWGLVHGETELIPLFRPATSDLNMTFAMSITSVVLSHVFGVFALGFFKYWNKFIQLGTVWHAMKGFGRRKLGEAAVEMFTAIIELGVGFIELISEAAKMISLALRLFGNIFAGEVLIHVLSSLIAFLVPTPFMFLELIVGVVQALVFSMLVLVYLTLATEKPHGGEEAHAEDDLSEAHGTGKEHAEAASHA